jgi:hypothetical protein
MIDGKNPPVLSMLNSAEKIFKMRRNFRFIFFWAILASVWIIISFAVFFAYLILPLPYKLIVLDSFVLLGFFIGLLILILSPYVILSSSKRTTQFEQFLSTFYPIWVKAKVELYVPSPTEIPKSIEMLISEIDDRLTKYDVNPKIPTKYKSSVSVFDFIMKSKRRFATIKIVRESDSFSQEELKSLQRESLKMANIFKFKSSLLVVVLENVKSMEERYIDDMAGVRSIILGYYHSEFSLNFISPLNKHSLHNKN